MDPFFAISADPADPGLVPLPNATGSWSENTIRGPAIALALSRALEVEATARPELRAVRATFELHSPVPRRTLLSRSRSLRDGRRLLLAESELFVDGVVYARARGVFLRPEAKGASGGREAAICAAPPCPSDRAGTGADGILYWSEGSMWTSERNLHRNTRRKAIWLTTQSLVIGEKLSPLGLAAAASDMSNLVVNWGEHGISDINADVSLSLSRLPSEDEVGVAALTRFADGGIVIGSAILFDRRGAFGTTVVSALPAVVGADPRKSH